jgi:hypothetical protein
MKNLPAVLALAILIPFSVLAQNSALIPALDEMLK